MSPVHPSQRAEDRDLFEVLRRELDRDPVRGPTWWRSDVPNRHHGWGRA